MRKLLLLLVLLYGALPSCCAQADIREYSTSYAGLDGEEELHPFLLAAIPYAGNYTFLIDHEGPIDLSGAPRTSFIRELNTFDSSDAYFFAPGIHPSNAAQYEFRVLKDAKEVVLPWSPIHSFTTPGQEVNFKGPYAFLGGYRTTWDHYLLVDLRRKGRDSILSTSVVYWAQAHPVLLNIYTAGDLKDLLAEVLNKLKAPYEIYLDSAQLKKWSSLYPPDQLDILTGLPKKLILKPTENNIVFYLKAGIYKKIALEYALVKNADTIIPWHPGEFDHNFFALQNLGPGNYLLEMRYSAQRHNVTTYPFFIQTAWTQAWWFRATLAFLIVLMLALIWVFIRQRQRTEIEKYKRQTLHLELKSIRSQLNPHFIFNALASIQGLINKNEIAKANRYLSEFGTLMRDSLKGSSKDFTPLDKEIATLDTYLKLEQLRFHFAYDIQTADDLPLRDLEIPSLLLQPLVENAVKHGISNMREAGRIQIVFVKDGNDFTCLIRDNGKGYAPGAASEEGFGLKLTKDRIHLLNQVLKEQSITFDITGEEGKGTAARLVFKNWIQ